MRTGYHSHITRRAVLSAPRSALALAWLLPLAVALLIALSPLKAFSYDEGPDDGYAGNPPAYENCTVCHDSYPINSGDGGVVLLNLPTSFVPGNAYDLLVRVYDPGQIRWGFELTVLGPSDEQAGDLVVLDAVETQLSDNPFGLADFLKQTFDGTHEGSPGPTTWPFRWVAPNVPTVTFYVAGNAGDASYDPAGDYIYLQQVHINQATTGTEGSSWGKIKSLYAGQ